MERLIESILSIQIKDEKDLDNHYEANSCATSMDNRSMISAVSHKRATKLNMSKVSHDIDMAMNGSVSMRDIPQDER